jgi:Secretion system C-terminal sorting domain
MKRFVFFICLILSYTCVIANTPDLKKTHDDNTKILLDNCSLPAPTGLVASITPQNLVSLTWDVVPGAVDYEIKTIEVSTGNVFNTSYTTNTSIVINPGPPQCYSFEVTAGCGSGQYSEKSTRTDPPLCIEWVIDLVINRNIAGGCTSPTPPEPLINGSIDINIQENSVQLLTIKKVGSENDQIKIAVGEVAELNHIKFSKEGGELGDLLIDLDPQKCVGYGTGLKEIFVRQCIFNKSKIKLNFSPGIQPILTVTVLDFGSNYTVSLTTCTNDTYAESSLSNDTAQELQGNNDTYARSSLPNNTNQESQVSATPNPFTNEINLYLPDMESEHTTIQLFDLTGKFYYSKLSGLSTNQVTIPTSELPTGIYILRTQTADRVQTIKMIKTE